MEITASQALLFGHTVLSVYLCKLDVQQLGKPTWNPVLSPVTEKHHSPPFCGMFPARKTVEIPIFLTVQRDSSSVSQEKILPSPQPTTTRWKVEHIQGKKKMYTLLKCRLTIALLLSIWMWTHNIYKIWVLTNVHVSKRKKMEQVHMTCDCAFMHAHNIFSSA